MGVQINGDTGNVIATKGTYSGNVTIGGTLTYEDVTNIDSVGLVTARTGIEIGARPGVAASISVDGNMIVSGISTFGGAANFAAISGTTGTFTGDVDIADKIVHSGDTNTAIRFPEGDHISFETAGSEAMRIDNGGKLLIGLDDRRLFAVGVTSKLQLEGLSSSTESSISIVNNQANTGSPSIRLGKTRGTSAGSNTSVADGDNLGQIIFYGADGTDIYNATALIGAKVNGTVGTDTIPTDLVFQTSATTSNARTERFRITSDGKVGINATNPTCQLQINSGSGGDGTVTHLELNHNGNNTNDAVKLNFARAGGDIGSIVLEKVASNNTTDFIFNTRASNTVSESMRIAGDGQLLIGGHSSPHNSAYRIDIQADTSNMIHGVAVRATALQNDTFCVSALAHVTPSGAATQRRAHIGCYRNGSSQPGGYVYMSQQDGGNTYIWPDSSNILRISNASSNVTNDAGTVVGSQTSDVRLKNVLGDVTYGLAEINKINPIQFNFKNDENVQKRIGFSAQDLQSIIPESVYNTKNTKEVDGVEIEDVLGMEYVQITPVLVNAVKELSTEIDNLKAEIAALKSS